MCKIEGCRAEPIAKGLCAMHYMRLRRQGDASKTGKPGRPRIHTASVDVREVAALKARIAELEAELARRRKSEQAPKPEPKPQATAAPKPEPKAAPKPEQPKPKRPGPSPEARAKAAKTRAENKARKENRKRAEAAAKAEDEKIKATIDKLKAVTTARGASAAEESKAKAVIAKLEAKLPSNFRDFMDPRYRPPPLPKSWAEFVERIRKGQTRF